jgi:hypothetical protein
VYGAYEGLWVASWDVRSEWLNEVFSATFS